MICDLFVDGVLHGCFIPVLKTDLKLEVTGCDGCIKEVVKKAKAEKKMTVEDTKRLIGIVED